MKDYYRILEIHPDASLEVMNKAYRALVQKYHPDHYHLSDKVLMQEKMKDINEAYEILSNETTRKQYDRKYRVRESDAAERPPAKNSLKNIFIWGVVTFLTVKFLIKPFLMNPSFRILILGLILLIVFRFFLTRRRV